MKRQDLKNHPGDYMVAPELKRRSKVGTPVEIHLDHGVSIGVAFFDIEVHFPSFALFLDDSNALILKPTGRAKKEFERIGIARFIRTKSQIYAANDMAVSSPKISGLITGGVPRSCVRIV